MREIFAYDRIGDQECELAPLTEAQMRDFRLEAGDLLFARQSLTYEGAGKCSLVIPSNQTRTWESHLIRVRLDLEKASPGYYFAYFQSDAGRENMQTIIQQVAAAGIRGSDLRCLRVPHPSIEKQRAIAEVLGALDDKIAANARLATAADALIRAEFDALRGRYDETVTIGALATSPRQLVNPASVPGMTYVGLEHMPRRSMWLGETGWSDTVTSSKSIFESDDVLFGKLRPNFHKVVAANARGLCSTEVLVVRPTDPTLNGYLLAAVSSDDVVAHCVAGTEGTRMPRTSWKDLAAAEVPWPGTEVARNLSLEIVKLRSRVASSVAENSSLAATRDALLPLLMSGAVTVKDAEAVL